MRLRHAAGAAVTRWRQPAPNHQSRIEALAHEIGRLRQQLAQLHTHANAAGSDQLIIDGVIVEALPQGLLFRILQPFGKAQCAVGPELRLALAGNAALSHHVEIRGHTDANIADPANRRAAARRARCARDLLLAAGIPAARLHSSHLAAGSFIADNRSAEGRALNRRIDIELRGLPLAAQQLDKLRRSAAP